MFINMIYSNHIILSFCQTIGLLYQNRTMNNNQKTFLSAPLVPVPLFLSLVVQFCLYISIHITYIPSIQLDLKKTNGCLHYFHPNKQLYYIGNIQNNITIINSILILHIWYFYRKPKSFLLFPC